MASYRGYFQGMQDMRPTALSQVLEQVFRVVVGLGLAYTMFYGSVSFSVSSTFSPGAKGAAGATLGAAAGAVGGLFVVLIIYAFTKNKIKQRMARERTDKRDSASLILKKIAIIAVPITIGAAIMPIVNMIDAGMVNDRLLASGWDEAAAKNLYGQLTGFAGPLINFPQVLTQAVAMSLVPLVAAAYKHKDMLYLRQNVATGLRTAVILGLPCAMGLFVLAEPILLLLYPNQPSTATSTAPCLMTLSVGVIFLSTVQTLTGVLQGIGKQMIPVRNLCIGVVIKVILTWTLTGIQSINVLGAATGTVCAYLIASVLNIIAVRKYTGTCFALMPTVIKPMIASTTMAICAWGGSRILDTLLDGSRGALLLAIVFAAMVYVVMLFVTKTITKEEVAKMPHGNKIAKILGKFVK
jgi:stage V sporulation protein B